MLSRLLIPPLSTALALTITYPAPSQIPSNAHIHHSFQDFRF